MFHPFSYNYSTNKDNKYKNNNLYNIQLKEFGQTPEQLFFKPHPKKFSKKIVEIQIKNDLENKIDEENNKKEEKNEKIEQKENKKIDESKVLNKIKDIKIKEKNTKRKEDKKKIDIINIQNNNIISKPFPVIPDIDFKLKRQYKSVIKYDNIELTTGTILPNSNLILSGNIDGHLNIYDYFSGDIIKYYSLAQEINNINPVNEKIIIYSSEQSINIFDTSLGKNISSFYAHDKQISSLFYDENYKNIISSTNKGIIHAWDFNRKSIIPIVSHFLFDQKNIISADYNSENKFFHSLGDKGNINILNIFNDEEIYNWKIDVNNNKPVSVNVNLKNINQFIVGFEKGFNIYDLRNFGCVEEWNNILDFKVDKCIIDSSCILMQNELGLKLYDYKEKKLMGERVLNNKIKFFNFYHGSKDTKIVYGDSKGNVYYSVA